LKVTYSIRCILEGHGKCSLPERLFSPV